LYECDEKPEGVILMATGPFQITTLTPSHPGWPLKLNNRLGRNAPSYLQTIGNLDILAVHKVGLFSSVRCPGDAILRAYDTARELRDNGVTVVSGFHSPVEKECLRILLRGKQPIVICLARAMEKIRITANWREALDTGRLLLLSPFEKRPRRPTIESSQQRNELVAALADEVLIIHATPGGSIERISELANQWNIHKKELP
jgi:predicted Rossmann fold nucleotide-binding protein DprA/Smf involved in DNA uptake